MRGLASLGLEPGAVNKVGSTASDQDSHATEPTSQSRLYSRYEVLPTYERPRTRLYAGKFSGDRRTALKPTLVRAEPFLNRRPWATT
jgi:hypothetical protein